MNDIAGTCPAAASIGLTRDVLRPWFGGQLIWGWDERVVPLALIYRIQRCDPADVTALQYFADHATNPIDGLLQDRLFSAALGNHIGLSDLWEEPVPSLADEQALIADALWAFGSTTRLQLAPQWPTYPEDEYADVFGDSPVPILSINGELDPASPLAQAIPVG